jgi:hypothetical protein
MKGFSDGRPEECDLKRCHSWQRTGRYMPLTDILFLSRPLVETPGRRLSACGCKLAPAILYGISVERRCR